MTALVPAYRSAGKGRKARADEALALADRVGLELDGWQRAWLRDCLTTGAGGRWVRREAALICPRQNGKGRVLEAMELAGLFVFGEELILHSAHEFKTAKEGFRRLWSWIESTPDLFAQVVQKLDNNNDSLVELESGQRLRYVARTRGSARGFSGDRVILDEAYNLPEEAVSALAYTMGARPDAQLIYTSSAPLPFEHSAALRRVCKRGRAGDPTLIYAEWKAPDDADVEDEAAWAQANPGYPYLITDDAIRMELGLSLPADFARERLGIWPEDVEFHRVIPADAWGRCHHDRYPKAPVTYAVDVSPDAGSGAIAASDGTTVDVVEHRDGTGWMVPALEARLPKGAEVVLDPAGPAGVLVGPLDKAGIRVREVTLREHVAAAGQLLTAVIDGALSHPGHPGLDAAAAGADRRDIGDGGWLWSRRRSNVDIAPLVAVTLARGFPPSVTRAPRIHTLSTVSET